MVKKRKNSANTGKVVSVDSFNPESNLIRDAADVLQKKGVVVFPTSGLYGLGANAFSPEAIDRVYSIKQRPLAQPLLVLIPRGYDLSRVARSTPDYVNPLFGLWPGDITLIFEAARGVPRGLTGGTDKIGVRRPAHPVAQKLVDTFGGPITGTSANLSGFPSAFDIKELAIGIKSEADMVLDVGPLSGGAGSTILDVSCWPVKMIREGRISSNTVRNLLEKG